MPVPFASSRASAPCAPSLPDALPIFGGNPVYDAPADFNFAKALDKVPFRAHLSHYYDETSMLSHWHVPETHYLETWGDARGDRKSTRLNSSHRCNSYAVLCLKKKNIF